MTAEWKSESSLKRHSELIPELITSSIEIEMM